MLTQYFLPILLLWTCLPRIRTQQLVSPCPRLFSYEPKGAENDRWYGTLTLLSDSNLQGVWLRIVFDKQSLQLGNWFGEVVTTDNKEYLIKNPKHRITANQPYNLRFYIKYNPAEPPPRLVEFRLNAKTVCPEGGATTEAPTTTGLLITSSELSTTSNPLSQGGGGGSNTFSRPGSNNNFGQGGPNNNFGQGGSINNFGQAGSTDEENFFPGDFSVFQRPNNNRPADNFNVACGTVVKAPKPLITHGQATHEGEFPWHAALYHAKGIDLTYICGASLVSEIHLITVAHCVTRRNSNYPLNTDSLVVYLGKYYLKRWSNPGVQDKPVDRITVHPEYNPQAFANDIAVVKLDSPVQITNWVRPVCLWSEDNNLQAIVSKAGTVVGWGFDENGIVTEELKKAKMPVVTQETCIYSFPDFYSRFTSSKTFCAGFKNGTSVCNGDSGGGMVFPKSGTTDRNTIWQLRGLVSISVALQNHHKCDSSHYVVFTDVAKYLDWVRGALN